MDTFPPPAPLQPQFTTIPTINTNFSVPNIVNTVAMDIEIEAPNNISHSAANPTPSPTPALAPNSNHPPYAEMISSAIEALKEKDGSSKRAIAKYIEQSYIGLPPTHSTLLSHHLKRLKNSGHLVMVKKSYKLQRSDSVAAAAAAVAAMTQSQTLPTSGTPRGRGRPPKPKPDLNAQPAVQPTLHPSVQPISQNSAQPIFQPFPQPFPQPVNQFNGQPTDPAAAQFNGQPAAPVSAQFNGEAAAQTNPQPVFVALGLADEPITADSKKRPGRPRKIMAVGGGVAQGAPGFANKRRGRPPGSKGKLPGTRLSKRSPGRPRKPKSVLGLSGPKRGPGRPSKAEPKTMIIPYATTNVPVLSVIDQNSIPGVISVHPKPRGRPKKVAAAAAIAAAVGILSGKRRGRPPKGSGVNKLPKVSGVNKLRSPSGRSVGRPKKKNALQPTAGASDALIATNGDLKRKLDYFQSKVKQAVGMLKPQLTHDSSATAIAAVQELEELATMDVNTPLSEEVHQPVAQT